MKGFFSSTRFKVLLVILFLLIGFIMGAAGSGMLDSVPSTVVNFITSPIERFVTGISNSTIEFFKKFTRAEAYYNENTQLKKEIDDLTDQLIDYNKIKQENERLKGLVNIQEADDENEYVSAMIIEKDIDNPFQSFTIDKGEMDGITVGDPIIVGSYLAEDDDVVSISLVGEVVSVTSTTSTVMTILDPGIGLGAYSVNETETEKGLISGNIDLALKGLTRMNNISNGTEMKVGDSVLTTGFSGGTYPKDIKIGTVESVNKESFGTSMYAEIKPYVDISKIKDVFVMTYFRGKGADAMPSGSESKPITSSSSSTSSNASSDADDMVSSDSASRGTDDTSSADSTVSNNETETVSNTDN